MRRSAKVFIVIVLSIALVSSLGITATAAPTAGDAAATTVAKKKKKKCRKGYVRTRVTEKKGRNKGKRVVRCVKKTTKRVPQLSPV